jgi:hypothetical protein
LVIRVPVLHVIRRLVLGRSMGSFVWFGHGTHR